MIIKYFKDYIISLNEGLIKTLPGEVVCKAINNSLGNMPIVSNCDFINNKLELTISNFNTIPIYQIESLFDHIMVVVVNQGGWFPSIMVIDNNNSQIEEKYDFPSIINNQKLFINIKIIFESKFDEIDEDIPNKLYHLTIKEYERNINKYGLVPKSKLKLSSHLDRIYVCKTIEECEYLIPKMTFYYNSEKYDNIYKFGKKLYNKDIRAIIYEIDNSDGFITKLYKDINYQDKGFYILYNIHKNKLKVIKTNFNY